MAANPDGAELKNNILNNQDGESADEYEDEDAILEESPCGRWQKRRKQVTQRDVPGIDKAYLAMDTEEGVEVVWNEVRISDKKIDKGNLDNIKTAFDNLVTLAHNNIIKFHKYWIDAGNVEKGLHSRMIFITEYMTSGSLKNFLKKTKRNNRVLKSWKRWCTQILTALSYLHTFEPPIIHGYLTCDTIFIQHNGLIKIGSVAPDFISSNVKSCREVTKNYHYMAPEYQVNSHHHHHHHHHHGNHAASDHYCEHSEHRSVITTAADIFSFGICALEMAVLEFPGNGDRPVPRDVIDRCLENLEDPVQRDFIAQCLHTDPQRRPAARDLLFHKILFEVHSLKLMAAHCFVHNKKILPVVPYDEYQRRFAPDTVMAETVMNGERTLYLCRQCPQIDLEEFLKDVGNGFYPLTPYLIQPPRTVQNTRAPSPDAQESVKSDTPEPYQPEMRPITHMQCQIRKTRETGKYKINLSLKLDERLARTLSSELLEEDTSSSLAVDLVTNGFISESDQERVAQLIEQQMQLVRWPLLGHNGKIVELPDIEAADVAAPAADALLPATRHDGCSLLAGSPAPPGLASPPSCSPLVAPSPAPSAFVTEPAPASTPPPASTPSPAPAPAPVLVPAPALSPAPPSSLPPSAVVGQELTTAPLTR